MQNTPIKKPRKFQNFISWCKMSVVMLPREMKKKVSITLNTYAFSLVKPISSNISTSWEDMMDYHKLKDLNAMKYTAWPSVAADLTNIYWKISRYFVWTMHPVLIWSERANMLRAARNDPVQSWSSPRRQKLELIVIFCVCSWLASFNNFCI